jgi:hypothetical protein
MNNGVMVRKQELINQIQNKTRALSLAIVVDFPDDYEMALKCNGILMCLNNTNEHTVKLLMSNTKTLRHLARTYKLTNHALFKEACTVDYLAGQLYEEVCVKPYESSFEEELMNWHLIAHYQITLFGEVQNHKIYAREMNNMSYMWATDVHSVFATHMLADLVHNEGDTDGDDFCQSMIVPKFWIDDSLPEYLGMMFNKGAKIVKVV